MANPLLIAVGLGLVGISLMGGKAGAANRPRESSDGELPGVSNNREKLTTSSSQSARSLIDEARALHPGLSISVEEMTAARLIASEHGSANAVTAACIVDAELNRAARKGKSLLSHLTGGTGIYGRQGLHDGVRRPAATRQNPTLRHLEIAKRVVGGPDRGISRGAERFFDPKVQLGTHLRFKREGFDARIIATCHPLGTLKAWSFDLGSCKWPDGKSRRCCKDTGMPSPSAKRGSSPEQFVGQIPGVDPTRLMLMKPSQYGPEHTQRYEEAAAIIRQLG